MRDAEVEYDDLNGWRDSASAWVALQGEHGDTARREVLDPALEAVWGDLAGKRVLDVGCGEGRYARKLAARGAAVAGLDPVDEFVEIARSLDPSGEYVVGKAEGLPFENSVFDFVLSYLSLVDIVDDRRACGEMVRVAKPGGGIVVATISNVASTTANWVKDEDGNRLFRTVDRYMEEFALDLEWSGLRIKNFHRPLSRTMESFLSRGCVLTQFLEPLPPASSVHYESEFRVPTFQILVFRKDMA